MLAMLSGLGCGGKVTSRQVDAGAVDAGGKAPRTFYVDLAPARQLDLVFMIGSCCAKLSRLNSALPKLLDALEDPDLGTPDLRIAIADPDLGSGGAYTAGACAPNGRNGNGLYGDQGAFQMRGAGACGVTNSEARWIEYTDGAPVGYRGDLGDVLACLTTNLGTSGCSIEQPLQALEFALTTKGVGNDEQQNMLRPYAQLAVVLLSENDDCSATPNVGMFGDKPELWGETAGLRCATRAHACGGVNLTKAPPGYPTTAGFSAPFASCKARTDACPNQLDGATTGTDTAVPTDCSPLKSIKVTADRLKALKLVADQKVLVAGIFGWPRAQEMATATYQIGLVPNPNPADAAHPQLFDRWPVCYAPGRSPRAPDVFDADAWGGGAPGGLRLAAFLDEFGNNGLKFSICESDYGDAMTTIGTAIAKRMKNGCLSADVDRFATCTAQVHVPDGVGGFVPFPAFMPSCDDDPTADPCYTLVQDSTACAANEYLVQVIPPSYVTTSTILQFDCK
jgi:hypothetical protein